MPCRSDYPKLTSIEDELTTIYNIQEDLKGEFKQFKYPHPKIYESECNEERLNKETKAICKALQTKSSDEINSLYYTTQRWWLEHKISDFKRMVLESKQVNFNHHDYSEYELNLINKTDFLNDIIEDVLKKIKKRFENFNEGQNPEWQKNITRRSFIQAMSAYELFSELLYFKIFGTEVNDTLVFKDYDKSDSLWKDLFGRSFNYWISITDQFELKKYFEKYIHVVSPSKKAQTYFRSLEFKTEVGKTIIFTIDDSNNLIKILSLVKNGILKELI